MELIIPSTLRGFFSNFVQVFTAPSFENFMTLVTGWLLCTGKHTITGALRAGAKGSKHFSTMYRFFSRAKWEPDEMGRVLFDLLMEHLPGNIHILVDDTLCRRSGPHFWGAGMHHDPLKSSYGRGSSGGGHHAFAFGHNRVTLALWIPVPWGIARGMAVPFLWRVYRQKKRCPEAQYRTRPELARELLETFTGWDIGGRKITVVGDREYACQRVVRGLPQNVEFIGSMVMNAALCDQPRCQSRIGRRRLKGVRLPSPQELAASSRRWKTVSPVIYRQKVAVKIKTQMGMWYRVAGTRMVRMVVTRDPSGRIEDRAYFTTNMDLSVEELLEGFSRRWALEVAFRDAKQNLGLEEPQNGWWRKPKRKRRLRKKPGPQPRDNRGRRAIEHTVPLVFCTYGLVIAWYLRHGNPENDVQRARKLNPWYRQKMEPSFIDMLNAARRAIWSTRVSATPLSIRDRRIILKLLPPWSMTA